jgi:hypothetical protein
MITGLGGNGGRVRLDRRMPALGRSVRIYHIAKDWIAPRMRTRTARRARLCQLRFERLDFGFIHAEDPGKEVIACRLRGRFAPSRSPFLAEYYHFRGISQNVSQNESPASFRKISSLNTRRTLAASVVYTPREKRI